MAELYELKTDLMGRLLSGHSEDLSGKNIQDVFFKIKSILRDKRGAENIDLLWASVEALESKVALVLQELSGADKSHLKEYDKQNFSYVLDISTWPGELFARLALAISQADRAYY